MLNFPILSSGQFSVFSYLICGQYTELGFDSLLKRGSRSFKRFPTLVWCIPGRRERGTSIYWLYGYVPLERVWVSSHLLWDRV